jgi:hypothetical protein
VNDLLKLAIEGHGGLACWERFTRFRVAGSITGGPAVHYPSAYREFGGIMVPIRRRVFVRRADGSPVLDQVSVAIDFTDVTFA